MCTCWHIGDPWQPCHADRPCLCTSTPSCLRIGPEDASMPLRYAMGGMDVDASLGAMFFHAGPQVFIAGSETTAEHRAQIYTPSYLQNGKPRPAITSSPPTVGYSASFPVGFSGVPSLDRIVLNRLASATHSNHFDQRQVVLDCTDASNVANCQSPPNSSIAPPGTYQLFVLYQGVPSRANLVNLTSGIPPPPVDNNLGSGLPNSPAASAPVAPSGPIPSMASPVPVTIAG